MKQVNYGEMHTWNTEKFMSFRSLVVYIDKFRTLGIAFVFGAKNNRFASQSYKFFCYKNTKNKEIYEWWRHGWFTSRWEGFEFHDCEIS